MEERCMEPMDAEETEWEYGEPGERGEDEKEPNGKGEEGGLIGGQDVRAQTVAVVDDLHLTHHRLEDVWVTDTLDLCHSEKNAMT